MVVLLALICNTAGLCKNVLYCTDVQVAGHGQGEATYSQQAASHASAAATAAATAPAQHAAALLAAGHALMQQAHLAMITESLSQERQQHRPMQVYDVATLAGKSPAATFNADSAWVPWPKQAKRLPRQQSSMSVAGAETTNAATGSVLGSNQPHQLDQTGLDAAIRGGQQAGQPDATDNVNLCVPGQREVADAAQAPVPAPAVLGSEGALVSPSSAAEQPRLKQLPQAAVQPHSEAVQLLQQALSEALACQQLATARAAALGLMRCYGLMQPQLAVECLAVAQSCHSAASMKAVFQRCEWLYVAIMAAGQTDLVARRWQQGAFA